AAVEKYPVGSLVAGKITNVTDFGIFVEVEEGIEGLVHVSEISKEKVSTPVGLYTAGDSLETRVINVSAKDRKIGLSIKALAGDSAEANYQDFKKLEKDAGPSTIGDLLKEEFESKDVEEDASQDDAGEVTADQEQEETT
ncbi:MAG: S1 RNA-binding domain-containing protein, partial [Desulfobulbaceae bacterium]|nr:S1 RNA-binding domain-containing protein [Desulfobulbaceae bacterium]